MIGFSNVFCVFNQKGGVGKTTTTVNLSAILSILGKKILIVDFDPQANASTGLGVYSKKKDVYNFLFGNASLEEVVSKTELKNLTIIPSSQNLSGSLIELVNLSEREFFLKKALEPYVKDYDYIFIDCPPSLCLLSLNALVSCSKVLIPLQSEYYALEGLSKLINTVKLIKDSVNKILEIDGIVLTMFDKRNSLSKNVEDDVRAHLGDLVYKTKIPRNTKISESPSFGKPVILYDSRCIGSESYLELANEFLSRNKN
jgi:chromosome partitioning protein